MSGLHRNEVDRIVALRDRLRVVGHKNGLSALRGNDSLLFLQKQSVSVSCLWARTGIATEGSHLSRVQNGNVLLLHRSLPNLRDGVASAVQSEALLKSLRVVLERGGNLGSVFVGGLRSRGKVSSGT